MTGLAHVTGLAHLASLTDPQANAPLELPMKLSIVELATVAPGTTETEALADALDVARHGEANGFHRIWFAEHHLSHSGASHHPELLIAAAAMQTSRIRLGSGGVLMNHYSPGTRFRTRCAAGHPCRQRHRG